MPDSPPPTTLAWLRHAASCGKADAQLTLHILERLEALEKKYETQRLATLEWGKDVDKLMRWIDDHLKRIMALEQPRQDKLDRLIEQDSEDDDEPQTLHTIALRMVDTLEQLRVLPEILDTLRRAIREPIEQPPAAQPESVSVLDAKAWAYIGRRAILGDPDAQSLVDSLSEPPAAQDAPPAAPAGGLVELVAAAIADDDAPVDLWHDDARAAIRVVAAWLDQQGQHGCSLWLREEAGR